MKIIARYIDDQYEYQKHDHTRKIVRAILYNDKKEICLIHIVGDDIFSHRDVLETPGGGVEKGETLLDALRRELLEEVGAEIDDIKEIGRVIDYYNLIKRKNDNHYYLAHLKALKPAKRTSFEEKFFQEIRWLSIKEALKEIENEPDLKWARLVKQREIPIIKIAEEMLNDK